MPSICKEENYNKVYREQAKSVRNFVYYKCGNVEKAEDITHESFIKLWKNCRDVLAEKAKSYLFTVAYRLFLNDYDHKKVVLKFERELTWKNNVEDPSYIIEHDQFKEKLEIAISNLPDTQREAFLLNRIEKMTYQQIAEAQEVSVKAVEKRISKALKKLKLDVEELNENKF